MTICQHAPPVSHKTTGGGLQRARDRHKEKPHKGTSDQECCRQARKLPPSDFKAAPSWRRGVPEGKMPSASAHGTLQTKLRGKKMLETELRANPETTSMDDHRAVNQGQRSHLARWTHLDKRSPRHLSLPP